MITLTTADAFILVEIDPLYSFYKFYPQIKLGKYQALFLKIFKYSSLVEIKPLISITEIVFSNHRVQ